MSACMASLWSEMLWFLPGPLLAPLQLYRAEKFHSSSETATDLTNGHTWSGGRYLCGTGAALHRLGARQRAKQKSLGFSSSLPVCLVNSHREMLQQLMCSR